MPRAILFALAFVGCCIGVLVFGETAQLYQAVETRDAAGLPSSVKRLLNFFY